MSCILLIEPEAERDLAGAYRWYETHKPGLGREFLSCVEAVFDRISRTPEIHAVVYKQARLAMVRRFPYVVCYVVEANTVSVVAVFHGHRDPEAWKVRVP